jgi:hypothetical protein
MEITIEVSLIVMHFCIYIFHMTNSQVSFAEEATPFFTLNWSTNHPSATLVDGEFNIPPQISWSLSRISRKK